MDGTWADNVATGRIRPKLRIAGRPREGSTESYVILEEPGEPVQVHFRGQLVPHFRSGCPHCAAGAEEPKSMWYVGAATLVGEQVILELTPKEFRTVESASRNQPAKRAAIDLFGEVEESVASFVGLLVKVSRAAFKKSPRIVRCEQRVQVNHGWKYRTREELARVWGIPIRPKLYRAEGG